MFNLTKHILLVVLFGLLSVAIFAENVEHAKTVSVVELQELFDQETSVLMLNDTVVEGKRKVKFQRGKAIIFCIFTGILGGHRIYFGTHQRTPIIYSVTLGGFGILPLVDLFQIIFTKDLSKFENKSEIIMWTK